MSEEWKQHPSGEYRQIGSRLYVKPSVSPGITDVYPVVAPADARAALDDALTEIQRLSDDRDHWETEAAAWQSTAALYAAAGATDDVKDLRATIVRQANEITMLKGESE